MARSGEHLSVVGEKDGWYQVSREGRISWIAGWLVQTSATEKEPDNTSNKGLTAEAGFLSISTSLGPDGYRLTMKNTKATEPGITTQDNKIIYTFTGVRLNSDSAAGSYYMGNNSSIIASVSAQTSGDTTRVTIELPLPYYYESKNEENECKQVFIIPPQLKTIDEFQLANGNQVVVINSTNAIVYQDHNPHVIR